MIKSGGSEELAILPASQRRIARGRAV